MLENAVRVCEAKFGVLFRYSDNAYHVAATLDVPPAYAEFLGRRSFRPDVEPALARPPLHRLLLSKEIIQSDDVSLEANPGPASQYGGARSFIAVPLKRKTNWSGLSSSIARRCGHLPINTSSSSRTSRPRPSSPSRTPACEPIDY